MIPQKAYKAIRVSVEFDSRNGRDRKDGLTLAQAKSLWMRKYREGKNPAYVKNSTALEYGG